MSGHSEDLGRIAMVAFSYGPDRNYNTGFEILGESDVMKSILSTMGKEISRRSEDGD